MKDNSFFLLTATMKGRPRELRQRLTLILGRPRRQGAALALLLAMMCLATACAFSGGDAPAPAPVQDTAADQEQALLLASGELFAQAEEAAAWFAGRAFLPQQSTGLTYDGYDYFPLDDSRFPDLAALTAYLEGLFSPELTARLLSREAGAGAPVFVDIEGRLCVFGGYAAQIPYHVGQRQFTARVEGGEAWLTLTYTADPYDSGSQTVSQDYTLSRDAAGVWRFTDFVLPVTLVL